VAPIGSTPAFAPAALTDGQQTAQEASHGQQDTRPTREPASQANAAQAPSHATGTVVSVQAIAACSPAGQHPGCDDRQPLPVPARSTSGKKRRHK
jgi:hypothetical protein